MGIESKPNSTELETSRAYEAQKGSFSARRNWVSRECENCGTRFFSKSALLYCGNAPCRGKLEFLHDERKRKIVSPIELNAAFQSFFEQKGFEIHPAKSILNEGGTTLFISAGVQVLDNAVLWGTTSLDKPLVVSQPSLRTQYLNNIDEGNSLSFVNICTEEINALPENHMRTLDLWMEFLSRLGIYMGDVTLHERKKEQQWGNIALQSKIIAVYYKGLEIGDGNYDFSFSPSIPTVSYISDFGFGLERLTWILRKESYFDSVGPLRESLKRNGTVQELVKTLTLLAASGLGPSNKDRGYRYRLFTKKLVDSTFPKYLNLSHLVDYYYQYWSHFVELSTQLNLTAKGVQEEYERNYNQAINNKLSAGVNPNCLTEEFLIKLLKTGTNRNQLAQLLGGD